MNNIITTLTECPVLAVFLAVMLFMSVAYMRLGTRSNW